MEAIKGKALSSAPLGRGICIGTFGFEVAEVGRGGSERVSGVSPGMSNVTTFRIDTEFCDCVSLICTQLSYGFIPQL